MYGKHQHDTLLTFLSELTLTKRLRGCQRGPAETADALSVHQVLSEVWLSRSMPQEIAATRTAPLSPQVMWLIRPSCRVLGLIANAGGIADREIESRPAVQVKVAATQAESRPAFCRGVA